MKFASARLRRLYESGSSRQIDPAHVARIRRILHDLDSAQKPQDLSRPGYRLHALKGAHLGYWSVRVSGNWRVRFRFVDSEAVDIDLIDYH